MLVECRLDKRVDNRLWLSIVARGYSVYDVGVLCDAGKDRGHLKVK